MEAIRWTTIYRRLKAVITPWRFAAVAAVAVLFFVVRIPLATMPYHQDEYKWAQIVDPAYGMRGTIPHPPLGELLFHLTGSAFGYDHLRVLPIAVSAALLIVVAVCMTRLYTRRAAVITALILSINTYALIASTQIDTDGSLLALFSVITVFGYLGVIAKKQMQDPAFWWLLGVGVVGGLFTKLSFVVVLAAIVADLISRKLLSRHLIIFGIAGAVVLGAGVVFMRGASLLSYAQQFFGWSTRAWGQIIIQCAKALIYASPLLVGAVVLALRRVRELRIWLLYIALHLFFYVVLFDFSHGALDRYLEFIIVPSAIMAGVLLDDLLPHIERQARACAWRVALVMAAALGFFALWRVSASFVARPLHPKGEFLGALFGGELATLIPLTGGSGPLGFYVPLGVVVVGFLGGAVAVVLIQMRRIALQRLGIALLVGVGISYSAIVSAELMTGVFFGSTTKVLRDTVQFVISERDVPQVITYNDTGAYELTARGKYFKRLYIDPAFYKTNREKIDSYQGHYLLVRFPELNRQDLLVQLLERCPVVYSMTDKFVRGEVRECRH